MTITSLAFAGFTLLVLGIYYLLPRRAQNYFLLAASYVFYISWQWDFALVLLGVTAFNFFLGKALASPTSSSPTSNTAEGSARRVNKKARALLWLGIAGNILTLAFFKYTGFYVDSLMNLFGHLGISFLASGLKIILPVGLSFYTLQAISYLADVFRGQLPAVKDPIDFALYLAYFPKMLAGPIERARDFLPKLAAQRSVDNRKIAESLTRILVGAFRKLVLSDAILALMPASVLQSPLDLRTQDLLVWWAAYGFIVYNDFAGYTSIVRGVSGLFGIELSSNFEYPFFSKGFAEFWNRWHITLSHWLRDYVYFPISRALLRRNPKGSHWLNVLTPPFVTMLISGLWHGAYWHLLLWGGLNGFFQGIERFIASRRSVTAPGKKPPIWRQILSRLFFLSVSFGLLVPFALQLPVAWDFIRTLNEFGWPELFITWLQPILAILLSLGLDAVQYRSRDEFVFLRWPRITQSLLLAFALLLIVLATRAQPGTPFIYQEF